MSRHTAPVLVHGYYGKRNTGDDAYCVVAVEVAARSGHAGDLALTAARSALPELPAPVVAVHPEPVRFRGQQRLAMIRATAAARASIHLGGSTFSGPQRTMAEQRRFAAAGRLQLHAIGVSVGPFADAADEARVRADLAAFTSISVRDRRSYDLLREAHRGPAPYLGFDVATVLPDTAWWHDWTATEDGRARLGRAPSGRIGVALCGTRAADAAGTDAGQCRLDRVVEAVRRAATATGAEVRLLVFSEHPHDGDVAVTERARATLADAGARVEVVGYQADTRAMLAAVAGCDAIVAMRLHSAVFAYALGVPFALAPYHRKCLDFATEIGLPPGATFPLDGPEPDTAVLATLLGSPDDLRATLPLAHARHRASASLSTLSAALAATSPTPGAPT